MSKREYNEMDYMMALSHVHDDPEAFNIVESLIKKHFAMIEHMKETSLFDVYMYEERFARNSLEPMRILANDNKRLKKEINNLRKQLGMIEKYKEE